MLVDVVIGLYIQANPALTRRVRAFFYPHKNFPWVLGENGVV